VGQEIRFAGCHVKRDLRGAAQLHFKLSALASALFWTLPTFAVLVTGVFALLGDFSLVPSVVVMLLFVGMVRGGAAFVLSERTWRATDLHALPVEGLATDEGLSTKRPNIEMHTPWAKFTGAKFGRDLVVLYFGPYDYGYVGRRLFSSDKEWQAFVDLVRTKVPLLRRGGSQVLLSAGLVVSFVLLIFFWLLG
jgi:hypothetical protein